MPSPSQASFPKLNFFPTKSKPKATKTSLEYIRWRICSEPFSPKPIFYHNFMILVSLSHPGTFTFSFMLKACERVKALNNCLELHGSVIRCGLRCAVIWVSLLRCYAADGLAETARLVFDKMPNRDLVSWNCVISCYSQGGFHVKALADYERMRNEKWVSMVSHLLACFLLVLMWVLLTWKFVCIVLSQRWGCWGIFFVGNALIDMYAKCGDL